MGFSPEDLGSVFRVVCSGSTLKQRELDAQLALELAGHGIDSWRGVSDSRWTFDLTRTEWWDLGALLWLVSLFNHLKRQGNELQLELPEPSSAPAQKLWSFFIRWRFFKLIEKRVDLPINLLPPHLIPSLALESKYALGHPWVGDTRGDAQFAHTLRLQEIVSYSSADSTSGQPGAAYDEAAAQHADTTIADALRLNCGWEKGKAVRFIREVFSEAKTNAFLHSGGTYVATAMRTDERHLTMAVSDNGDGIPVVLRRALKEMRLPALESRSDADLITFYTEPQLLKDSQLIRAAAKSGVYHASSYPGRGLYYARQWVEEAGGEMRVRSGRACVVFARGKAEPQDGLVDSPGTTVRVVVPKQTF